MEMTQEKLQKLLDEFGQSKIALTPQWRLDVYDTLKAHNHWDRVSKVNGKNSFKTNAIIFYQCDIKTGDIVKKWKGIKKCAQELNLSYQHISAVLQGLRKEHNGYYWIHKENYKKWKENFFLNTLSIYAKVKKEICGLIEPDTFTMDDVRLACKIYGYKSPHKFIQKNPFIEVIHEGSHNQYDRKIWRKR